MEALRINQKSIKMFRKLLFLLFPVVVIGQTNVNYTIRYSDKMEQQGLEVQVNYALKKIADSTFFHFSNEVWGEDNLINSLKFLKEDNPGYTFRFQSDSNRIIIRHPKTKNLTFSYRIKQDHEDNIKQICRPKVKNNYFHILGHSLFIIPEAAFDEHPDNPQLKVNIEWIGFPQQFKIHNTFATGTKNQVLNVRLWDELYRSLFVGGDYRIYPFSYKDKPVYFAIRGTWKKEYTDERLLELTKQNVFSQREFWKDNAFDYYTVIMTPTVTLNDSLYQGQSMKGSAVMNGFMIQSSNTPFNRWKLISYIMSHEMSHDWIGGKIQMKHDQLNFWFSEGFTDYYSYKNRLRSREITIEEWVEIFNTNFLKAYWENPEKNQPNYVIKDEFWKENIGTLPYKRGAIFAFWLDNQIMKKTNHTKSLDDVMRKILALCGDGKTKFTDEMLLETVSEYLNEDISYFFQKHIIIGKDFEFKQEDFINGFRLDHENQIPKLILDDIKLLKYIF